MAKLPAIQFYVGDWRKDPGIQSLSYHDRGVWFEILCLMHESTDRGKLLLNGRPMPDDALARLLGLDKQVLSNTLTTLLDTGVADRDPDSGALVNRRMVRDEDIRQKRVAAGRLGGNPALLNQMVKQKPTTMDKQKPTPSSSSSSSSSNTPPTPKNLPTTAEARRISVLYKRPLLRPWGEKEVKAFKKAHVTGDDLDLVEPYYASERAKGDEGRHRRDLMTFLNNFRGEVDRAREWVEKFGLTKTPSTLNRSISQEDWDRWWKAKYPNLSEVYRTPATASSKLIREYWEDQKNP